MNKFSTSGRDAELSILIANVSTLAKPPSDCSEARIKNNGPPLLRVTPLLYGQRAAGGGISLRSSWLYFPAVEPLPYEQAGVTEDKWGPSNLALVQSLHSISRAGYTSLKFTICNMKLEENEKCWQPAPSRAGNLGAGEPCLLSHTQPENSFCPAELDRKEGIMTQVPEALVVVTEI